MEANLVEEALSDAKKADRLRALAVKADVGSRILFQTNMERLFASARLSEERRKWIDEHYAEGFFGDCRECSARHDAAHKPECRIPRLIAPD